jgi:hypothetical protein
MIRKISLLNFVNKTLATEEFINKHKEKLTDFTRERVLKFVVVFMLILRNSAKSIQLMLNELFIQGVVHRAVSSSAYVQARKKFKHTAFIELNDGLVKIYYADDNIKRWKGYRCLATDGSKITLPNTSEMKKEFGTIAIKNQEIESSYAAGILVCCYDVLNRIAVKSIFESGRSYEVKLAASLLEATAENDLLIYDRFYASYEFLATLVSQNKNYLVRCPTNSFKSTDSLFKQEDIEWSKIVYLKAPPDRRKEFKNKGFPLEIKVRFVSVILSTGEIEVLATSLMDRKFTREDFKEAYNLRWGVEGFYGLIKGRLSLENFTGKTVESVKQDLWSTIFISNVETILTEDTEKEINSSLKDNQLEKKINKAVSFNVIKNMAFDLLLNENDKSNILEKMELLFKTNPILTRTDRSPPRKKFSALRSYNFIKRFKKQVF